MTKKYFLSTLAGSVSALLIFAFTAFAATPTLSLVSNGDGDTVQVNVSGDANSSVFLSYTKTNSGAAVYFLGTTSSSGAFSTNVSSSGYGIAAGSAVYVTTGSINGNASAQMAWPGASSTGTLSLSQSGLVMSVGQTTTITASNATGSIYLSNNSNPPIANVNINGNQISIYAIANGSTVVNICSGNSSTCASVYVTVGSSSASALTFSVNNITVAPGQSVPITISGGTGTYTVLNNSNSGVIQAGVNGSTVTLTTNATSGSAAVTICSSNMSSCGIINATAGTASSSPIAFSQSSPVLSVGQSLVVSISGGLALGGTSTAYYVSSNSSSSTVSSTISGANLILTGNVNGSAIISICSSAGSCGSLTATVSYSSSGGSLQLSQNTLSLLAGQVLTVTISGGATPYTISGGSGSIAQVSLNGNVISVSGITSGSSSVNVCSSAGACLPLSIIVNASGAGGQITFSQNNLSLTIGGSTSVTISGNGGYYPSSSTNPAVASTQISGNTLVITGLTAGSSNISVCQSGGQCAILFVTVTSASSTANIPIFSQTSPSLSVGQNSVITISGGASSTYYILSNTNPAVAQISLNNNQLTVSGVSNGNSTFVICAAANSCASLTATVGAASTTPLTFQTSSLPSPFSGQSFSSQLSASGGTGSYKFTISGGSLPSGLTLSGSGLISGTPTNAGSYNFSVTVTDSSGATTTKNLSIIVNSPSTNNSNTNPTAYQNGQLIKENGTIYIVYQNTKVAFTNSAAFLGLGFKFSNVSSVTNSGLSVSSRTVTTASGSHPRGAWISNGKAIYFTTPLGLIPVPDWATFLNNGGQANYIVKANSHDLAMTKLPAMTLNDSRMHQ